MRVVSRVLAAAGLVLVMALPTTPVAHAAPEPLPPLGGASDPTPEPALEPAPQPGPPAQPVSVEPAPVVTIPRPCEADHPYPTGADSDTVVEQLEQIWGIELVGNQWGRAEDVTHTYWEIMDAVDCTPFLTAIKEKNPELRVNATTKPGWAWGDWSLTSANAVTLDFAKMQQSIDEGDQARVVRVIVHELAHAFNVDRYAEPAYQQAYEKIYRSQGGFTGYGSSLSESFADAVGYYVARCAVEPDTDHRPYADGQDDASYELIRDEVFGGHEFAAAPGDRLGCDTAATTN
ncbi:hypothetical protein [Parenemella sanctibonifatiensis]|uniref:Uncharacterized protein n=1 Tax=Parenemella sanctibonifatiensis TaxID=2016505 RepID=A0A255EP00_9ACTN|nr:hypothetical protein [Parenemella sanctibonifatiensis]OYN91192.1 hypothetical protein CGZ91_06975 [Parenemella sanctibonifatiensis]